MHRVGDAHWDLRPPGWPRQTGPLRSSAAASRSRSAALPEGVLAGSPGRQAASVLPGALGGRVPAGVPTGASASATARAGKEAPPPHGGSAAVSALPGIPWAAEALARPPGPGQPGATTGRRGAPGGEGGRAQTPPRRGGARRSPGSPAPPRPRASPGSSCVGSGASSAPTAASRLHKPRRDAPRVGDGEWGGAGARTVTRLFRNGPRCQPPVGGREAPPEGPPRCRHEVHPQDGRNPPRSRNTPGGAGGSSRQAGRAAWRKGRRRSSRAGWAGLGCAGTEVRSASPRCTRRERHSRDSERLRAAGGAGTAGRQSPPRLRGSPDRDGLGLTA